MATTARPAGEFPRVPHALTDGEGRSITVRAHGEDAEMLLAMYEHFDDESRAQGLPPRSERRRREWLDELLSEGHTVVAVHEDAQAADPEADSPLVGHAVLLPYDDTAELAVFVRPDYQSAGIGTALVRSLLGLGRSVGLERVRLVVAASNRIALQLYRSTGFEEVERCRGEYEMARDL